MAIDINLDDHNPANEGGNRLPIGKHRVVLDDSVEVDRNGKRVQSLTFVVSEGEPHAGRKIKASLYEEGKDSDATKTCQDQICKYARVLGILERYERTPGDPKTMAYRYANGHTEIEFSNVIGTECVIDVVHREGKDSAGKPTGEVYVEPKMFGAYTLEESAADDAKKTAKANGKPGPGAGTTTPARGSNGAGTPRSSAPAAPPRQLDTSDL